VPKVIFKSLNDTLIAFGFKEEPTKPSFFVNPLSSVSSINIRSMIDPGKVWSVVSKCTVNPCSLATLTRHITIRNVLTTIGGCYIAYTLFNNLERYADAVCSIRQNFIVLFTKVVKRQYAPPGAWSDFRKFSVAFDFTFVPKTIKGHTHGEAASLRTDLVNTIRECIARAGWRMYDPSKSAAKRDAAAVGRRHVYTVQDVACAQFTIHNKLDTDVVTLNDTDYHLESLSEFSRNPMVLTSFIPTALSGEGVDSAYYYEDPETVVEVINGGAKYRSKLWDFSGDIVIIPGAHGLSFTIHNVHVHHVTAHKVVVFLAPSATIFLPPWVYSGVCKYFMGVDVGIEKYLLKRRDNVSFLNPTTLVGKFGDVMHPYFSVKRVDAVAPDSAVNISEKLFHNLEHMSLNKNCTAGTIAHNLAIMQSKTSPEDVGVLAQLFSNGVTSLGLNIIYTSDKRPVPIDESKLQGKPGCPPIIDQKPTVVHRDDGAAEDYVKNRLLPNQNQVEPYAPDIKIFTSEFIGFVVPKAKRGRTAPVDIEKVLAEQNRPAQVLRNEEAILNPLGGSSKTVKPFPKAETVAKVGSVRYVNNVEPAHAIKSAILDRTIKVILQEHSWWLIGKNPTEVAKVVQRFVTSLQSKEMEFIETDFSKLDERISRYLREEVFEPIAYAILNRNMHDFVKDVLEGDKECTAKIAGQTINLLYKNLSGSGLTTSINTIVNAWFWYTTLRRSGFPPEGAWSMLGMYYGDDGVTPAPAISDDDGPKKSATFVRNAYRLAQEVGLVVKINCPQAPSQALSFLGRTYPAPIASPVSYGDPRKILIKLQAVVGTRDDAIRNKLGGLYVTENHVPLVSHYIEACARAYKLDINEFKDLKKLNPALLNSFQQGELKNIFFNAKHGPIPYLETRDSEYLWEAVAKALHLTEGELGDRIRRLKSVETLDDFKAMGDMIARGTVEPDPAHATRI